MEAQSSGRRLGLAWHIALLVCAAIIVFAIVTDKLKDSGPRVIRGDGNWIEVWDGEELISEWQPADGMAYETLVALVVD